MERLWPKFLLSINCLVTVLVVGVVLVVVVVVADVSVVEAVSWTWESHQVHIHHSYHNLPQRIEIWVHPTRIDGLPKTAIVLRWVV